MHIHAARFIAPLFLAAAVTLSLASTLVNAQQAVPAAVPTAMSAASDARPAAATPKSDAGENPYGIRAVWEQGDLVARGTLMILIVMSMSSWYVIFTKLFEQAKILRQAKAIKQDFWAAGTVGESVDKLAPDSPFRFITDKALEGASKHDGLLGAVDFNTWVTMSIQRAMGNVQSRLQNGLAVLATVGSTAPFVGLFGTVWGIYHALVSIGMSGQASIDKVAGPVGEALIMTAIGLAVAVPAVLGYNWLVRRNKSAMESVQAFSGDLHAVMLATVKK